MPAADSLKKAAPPADTIPGEFYAVQEPVLQPRPRMESLHFWIPVVLFASFLLIVILRVFDTRRFRQLLLGAIRMSAVSIFYREEYALTNRVSALLLLNFLLTGGLFIYQVMVHLSGGVLPMNELLLFGLLAAGLLAAYTLKVFSVRLLGRVFELQEAAAEYSYNVLLLNKLVGLLLFPVTVLLAFAVQLPSEWLVYGGLSLWGIALFYRMLRGVLIGLSTAGVSPVNLFLYLCTLEILPFVLISKVFVGYF